MSVKARFIAQTLEKAGADMMSRQGSAIATLTSERSGRLLGHRTIDVSTGGDAEGRLTFTHTVYERFLDMRRLGGVKHKRRRIHNRFVFGTYSSIAARLMYGFTQEVIDAIKKDWPGEK